MPHGYGGTKHSDRQIKTLPIPMESHFTNFNARQSYVVGNLLISRLSVL
jgi:hypothetical protein